MVISVKNGMNIYIDIYKIYNVYNINNTYI